MNTPEDKLRRGQESSPIVVRFQLLGTLVAGSSAQATILAFGLVTYEVSGPEITVHSAIGGFAGVLGDRGYALYWPDSSRFETLPVQEGISLTPFQLNGPLAQGASALATIIEWDAGAVDWTVTGSTITVWDVPFYGPADYPSRGWAVYNDVNSRYEIISLPPLAGETLTPFVLDAALTLNGNAAAFIREWTGAAWTTSAVGITVYDMAGYGPAAQYDNGWSVFKTASARYEIVSLKPGSAVLRWAIALSNWTPGALNTSKVSCHEATGKDGADAGGAAFDVWLPVPAQSMAPNVRSGNIIGYMMDGAGLRIAVTGYLDDQLGMIKIWAGAAADIGQGWQLCDGTNGTPDLRERFVLGAFGDAGGTADWDYEGGSTNVDNTGGRRRELVNWEHTMFGSEVLRTFNTLQRIVQSESFNTEKEDPPLDVTISGDLDATGSYTDFALANIEVRDPNNAYETFHAPHVHGEFYDEGSIEIETGFTPALEPCTTLPRKDNCEGGDWIPDHVALEPGQANHSDPADQDPDKPEQQAGHRHAISSITVDTSFLGADLVWGSGEYDGHFHTVQAGTLDGKLHILDVTHGSPAGVPIDMHYHDMFLDNHQEYIKRIPPYYALCYIMRVD